MDDILIHIIRVEVKTRMYPYFDFLGLFAKSFFIFKSFGLAYLAAILFAVFFDLEAFPCTLALFAICKLYNKKDK